MRVRKYHKVLVLLEKTSSIAYKHNGPPNPKNSKTLKEQDLSKVAHNFLIIKIKLTDQTKNVLAE